MSFCLNLMQLYNILYFFWCLCFSLFYSLCLSISCFKRRVWCEYACFLPSQTTDSSYLSSCTIKPEHTLLSTCTTY